MFYFESDPIIAMRTLSKYFLADNTSCQLTPYGPAVKYEGKYLVNCSKASVFDSQQLTAMAFQLYILFKNKIVRTVL